MFGKDRKGGLNASAIARMQNWYLAQCDGDWEHSSGIKIETLDNPGWMLIIDIEGTEMEGQQLNKIQIERSEQDWVHCKLESGRFKAYGGPENLEEMINMFVGWTEGK